MNTSPDEPTSTPDRFDVLGLGIVTVDDFLFAECYPPPESKVRVRRRLRQCGGLTGTALVAASRLGARCGFAGSLDDGGLSAFIREALGREGVSLDWIDPDHPRPPIHSTILVDERTGSRTIFFEKDDAPYDGADWPPEGLIRAAKVLFLDHDHAERGVRAATIARASGVPVVADFEREEGPGFDALLALADHLILSRDFAARLTGRDDPADAARALWRDDRAVVVVTCGEGGCWRVGRDRPDAPVHAPAYRVAVVDTTGCGDVFHGAYAAALAEGLPAADRVRLAAAAAAIKATQPGGQAGIPVRDEVERFLDARSS
jgi:sugar/nucleoside kinase (ribokinase family)